LFYPQQTLVFSEQELVDIRVLTKADQEFQEVQRKQRLEQVKARERMEEAEQKKLPTNTTKNIQKEARAILAWKFRVPRESPMLSRKFPVS